MSLQRLLASVICKTFVNVCGKWQVKKPEQRALMVSFRVTLNHEVEEGYRYLDLALYAPYNYVSVYVRERWNTIPLADLEYNEEAMETLPKKGKGYSKGETPWKLLVSHDSGWSGGVQDFIQKNASKLDSFESIEDFYKLVTAAELFD